jgi:diaminohydroxyphosphoribosylaminopyrimidine deaminase/5-amino-6-(5-phosphoribosylamino)uracil reductase
MTNVLVEGGARVFGTLLDERSIDEIHAFVAPKLVGGSAPTPIAGAGLPSMDAALQLKTFTIEQLGADAYIHGRVR